MSAADQAFSTTPTLPLANDASPAPASLEGRKRLGGAFSIALDRIRPDPAQPRRRFDTAAHEELLDSVRRIGILQPITVRFLEAEAVYQIITGERRYQAARAAGLTEIPCWVQSPKEQEVLLHQIVENWQRLDMHPYDLADALARLRDTNGFSQRDLARETGKSEGEISKILALLDLDPAVQKLARQDESGRITRRHLYALRPLPHQEQLNFLDRVQKEAITASDMEEMVAERKEATSRQRRRGAPVSHYRFHTAHALVTVTFRKNDVSPGDILAALEEARLQASPSDASANSLATE